MTNQKTFSIFATEKIGAGATWEVYSNVSHDNVPAGMHPEDPFMFVCRNLCLEPRGHCWGGPALSSCRVLLPLLLPCPPALSYSSVVFSSFPLPQDCARHSTV